MPSRVRKSANVAAMRMLCPSGVLLIPEFLERGHDQAQGGGGQDQGHEHAESEGTGQHQGKHEGGGEHQQVKRQPGPALGPENDEIDLHARVKHEHEKAQVGQEGQPFSGQFAGRACSGPG